MAKVRKLEIGPENEAQRIDNFLLRILKGVPRSHIYRLLRTGQVRVNGGRIKADYKLVKGDIVRVPPVRVAVRDPKPTPSAGLQNQISDRILHEDDRLLVLDKPSGLAVHGGSGLAGGIIELLRAMRPTAPFLELVHRLDRDTSGILLIAKKRAELRSLHTKLRDGEIKKQYFALLAGSWSRRTSKVDIPLRKYSKKSGERIVQVDAGGKSSISDFRPIEYFPGCTLVDVGLLTGRTHQIRVHAQESGHPVVGDSKYGDRDVNKTFRKLGLNRLFLHAHSISFESDSGEVAFYSCPLPEDLRNVLEHTACATPARGWCG